MWTNVVLEYSNNRIATLYYSGNQKTPRTLTISGTNGKVKVKFFTLIYFMIYLLLYYFF